MPNKISLAEVLNFQNVQDLTREVSQHQGQSISYQQFLCDVSALSKVLAARQESHWALFCEHAYPFAVALFALMQSGKHGVIPGNSTEDTLLSIKQYASATIGTMAAADITLAAYINSPIVDKPAPMAALNLSSELTIFTSGSSGEAKAIKKTLHQFNAELIALEQCFAAQLERNGEPARIIATVSHQHIYGMIFRVLWPLAAKRVFISEQILDNAYLLRIASESGQPLAWVASPAHLKRLREDAVSIEAKAQILAVFSSGGPLPLGSAKAVENSLAVQAHEIFGSSETGGIAYRQQLHNAYWQPLPGVQVAMAENKALRVLSPHIDSQNWYQTEDAVTLLDDGNFLLQGRLDRIVKLEEKRLSLVELEQQLNHCKEIQESFCLLLKSTDNSRQRESLACVAQLSHEGEKVLQSQGKLVLVRQLKEQLKSHFELSLIPKKWRFVAVIPSNAQAKIDQQAIAKLFESHE